MLKLESLECGYKDTLIGPIDMEVDAGQFVLVRGPNGIGKSTLIKTLIGLLEPIAGSYEWDVTADVLRYVPQVVTIDVMMPATVEDVVETGLQRGRGWAGLRASKDTSDVGKALELVEMSEYADKLFRELSEGQKQLVLMARALLGSPKVLLLDEPASAMDPDREARAIEVLSRQADKHGLTILIIAHGSQPTLQRADAIIDIDEDGSVELIDAPKV
ncbi:MAG: metal ABC transporter ATP-binding protein [Myxococcota bacterium]